RKQARVVPVAFLDQDVERPLPAGDDGETRGAKPEHGRASQAFEHALSPPYRIAKRRRRLRRDAGMIPAVGRHFMPRPTDLAHEVRVSLRHPAEDEKGPPRPVAREQVQETRHTPRHPGLVAVPIRTTDSRLERRYVEVLLDVDAEVVGDHVTLPVQRMCPMAREAGGST